MENWTFTFDCTDLPWVVKTIESIVEQCHDGSARLEIIMRGPGGDWPEVTLKTKDIATVERMRQFLIDSNMCWTDENGYVHDYA